MLSWGDALLVLAGAFLAAHLLTDARRMVQVLGLRHTKYHTLDPCSRCGALGASIREAWWEIVTLGALVGHFIVSGEIGLLPG